MVRMLAVVEGYLVNYRRTWRGSVLGSFVLPVLIVVGFGVGVGRFVDAGGRLGPVRYLDYLIPGQIAFAAVNVAFFESAWPVIGRFRWTRVYDAMVATPLRTVDLIGGELLFIVARALLTTVVFLCVAAAFGTVHSPWSLAVPLVCALLALAVAAPVHAFAARLDNDSYFTLLMRFILIPAWLFSGVYFPVTAVPEALRWLAYALPLWHAVDLCRAATLAGGGLSVGVVLGHVGYLCLWALVGFGLALRAYRQRLTL